MKKARIFKSDLVRKILNDTSEQKKKQIQQRIESEGIYVTLITEDKTPKN